MNKAYLDVLRQAIQDNRKETLKELFTDIYGILQAEGYSIDDFLDVLPQVAHGQKIPDSVVLALEEAGQVYSEHSKEQK